MPLSEHLARTKYRHEHCPAVLPPAALAAIARARRMTSGCYPLDSAGIEVHADGPDKCEEPGDD